MSHDDDTCPHLVVLGRLEAENARLKAEVEQRTAQAKRHKEVMLSDMQIIADNRLEIEMLKEQVERLTKAGDAFVLLLEDEGYDMESIREVDGWNAAKEGKPTK